MPEWTMMPPAGRATMNTIRSNWAFIERLNNLFIEEAPSYQCVTSPTQYHEIDHHYIIESGYRWPF
jgi:hypothetical protein